MVDLSHGVSVSGYDLYAGFCIEGCLSFWREFGACGRWSPSVYSLLQGTFRPACKRVRAGPSPHMLWDIIFTDCFAIISAVRSAS